MLFKVIQYVTFLCRHDCSSVLKVVANTQFLFKLNVLFRDVVKYIFMAKKL